MGAESNSSLCDSALSSCKKVVQDYKDLLLTSDDMKEIYKKQRDEAIAKQGSDTKEKLEYLAIGGGAVAILCLIFKCNK